MASSRLAAAACAAGAATLALVWWRRERARARRLSRALRVVGVPEAVNMPWQFSELPAADRVVWADVSLGTGEMCRMLRAGEADAAVLLLEGAVNDIVAKRGPHKIVSECVASPLTWGGDEA